MKMGRFSGLWVAMAWVMAMAAPMSDAAAASERIQTLAQTCFACHGPGGVSVIPTRPNIGGQNAAYLALQLMRFKKGVEGKPAADRAAPVRRDPVMSPSSAMVRRRFFKLMRSAPFTPKARAISRLPDFAGELFRKSTISCLEGSLPACLAAAFFFFVFGVAFLVFATCAA